MSCWRTYSRQIVAWPADEPLDEVALRTVDHATFGWVRPLVNLSSPYAVDGWVFRTIRGGMLARAPGGRVGTGVLRDASGDRLVSSVEDYAPRVPRVVYEALQTRLHRVVVRAGARHAARRIRQRRGGRARRW